jgi:hypothetical protein
MGAGSAIRPAANLYDEDFAVWTAETARLLREGRFTEVDAEHLAEEIEDMGNRDRREVLSRLTLIIQHLLKWQYQTQKRSRSWRATVVVQQAELEHIFEQSPSLRRPSPAALERAYRNAVKQASIQTDLPAESFPRECPYTLEQILDSEFLPGR